MAMFKRKKEREELINKMDMMIAVLSRQSRFLKEQYDICYRQAERLAREGIKEASKKWLAIALVCRKMRSNVESQIADLFASRIQVEVTPPEGMDSVVARVNELLVKAEKTREITERAMGQLADITRLRLEAPSGTEYYGVSAEELEREFEEMQMKIGLEAAEELPEVPGRTARAREARKLAESEEAES